MEKLFSNGFSNSSLNEPIHIIFERQAQITPKAIAVCDNHQQLSYQQLNIQANQCANLIIEQGVQVGDVVALCVERSVDLVVAILAILKSGAAYLPLEPSLPESRQSYILNDAKINTILTQDKVALKPCKDSHLIRIDDSSQYPTSQPKLKREPDAKDLVYVLYTSGSTGQPKGVEIRHCSLVNVISYRVKHLLTHSECAVIPVTASLAFDASAGQIFTPICSGGKLVITDNLLEIAQSSYFNEITCIGSTPSVIRAFIEHNSLPLSLKVLFLGGENVEQDLCELIWEKTNISKLINLYGPTEATVHSTYAILFDRNTSPSTTKKPEINLPISIGKPISKTRILILNDNLTPCEANEAGEIYIAGIGLARGYRFRQTLTEEKFKNIQVNGKNISVYATGDLGILLSNGHIKFMGRSDRQVKLRGYRIELDEIESMLVNHQLVKQCAVEVTQRDHDKNIVAYLALAEDALHPQNNLLAQIKSELIRRLPSYMVPHYFIVLDTLPLTRNGKLDRKSLPSANQQKNHIERHCITPQNDLQNMFVDIWQDVLNVNPISINDHFFDLGGDSLSAVQVIAKLKKSYQLDINIGDIFNYPTIASLSEMVENGQHEYSRPQAILLKKSQNKPQLFCCSGINIYQALADCLASNCSTYGLYTPTEDALLNARQPRNTNQPNIKEIAHEYANIITKQQDQGPYYLLGISFGGVLAFETARLLQKESKEVSHLFLVDPILTSSVRKLPMIWLLIKLREALTSPIQTFIKIKKSLTKRKQALRNTTKNHQADLSVQVLNQFRQDHFRTLVVDYEKIMQTYSGDATLFHASARQKRPGYKIAADCGWTSHINGTLGICNIECGHLDSLKQPHVQQMANVIIKVLD